MRHIPGPLPCSALAIVILAMVGRTRIERQMPVALLVPAAHKACHRIEIMTVSLPLSLVFLHSGTVAGSLGKK